MSEHPGNLLRSLLAGRGWTQEELANIVGFSRQTIAAVLAGRSGISADLALALAVAFGNTADDWLRADAAHQLSIATTDVAAIERRAALYREAPIRDMQRRGWIRETTSLLELEEALAAFYGAPIHEGIAFPVAARRSVKLDTLSVKLAHLNPAERAWCFRARQLSSGLPVTNFDPGRMERLGRRLRQLAAFEDEVKELPRVLEEHGIRFLVIEPLPGCEMDGITFWTDGIPTIAVSVRTDRIDNLWFTVMHEYRHVVNGDAFAADKNLLVELDPGVFVVQLTEDEAEKRANDEAADLLVPQQELDAFIGRVGPLYATERIVQFAHRIKMHPGIIVGQLQRRGEVGYRANRGFLVKVRSMLTGVAITDGWGNSIETASH